VSTSKFSLLGACLKLDDIINYVIVRGSAGWFRNLCTIRNVVVHNYLNFVTFATNLVTLVEIHALPLIPYSMNHGCEKQFQEPVVVLGRRETVVSATGCTRSRGLSEYRTKYRSSKIIRRIRISGQMFRQNTSRYIKTN
jgi:hypothetical protein